MHTYFVYMLANQSRKVYVGVTNDLLKRMHDHRTGRYDSYTREFRITRLVYYEAGADIRAAIAREKQLKRWTRARKIRLIELHNGGWRDLSLDWFIDDTTHLRCDSPGEA